MKYAIFKPRETDRNFLFAVILTTVKMLFFVVLLIALTSAGLVAGIAKGWVDTAPDLVAAALTLILGGLYYGFQPLFKRKLSPIALIAISAVLGAVAYGL